MNLTFNLVQWIAPLIFILVGILAGFIIEKIILRKLTILAGRTKWGGDEFLLATLKGLPLVWLTIVGFYGAISSIQKAPDLLRFIQKALMVLVILSVTVFLSRVAVGAVTFYTNRVEGVLPSTSIFTNLTRLFVFLIGMLVVLQSLGISITPILTALGVGGLAVALALQDTLSNLFAGLHLIASRQVRAGDYVKLDTGEEGYVTDIAWRNTTIRALPNNMVVVPNSKVASAILTNYYLPEKELAVLVQMGVSYGSDLSKVERVTIEVAREVMREVAGGVPEFEPFIRYHTFADFSVIFTVILRGQEFVDQHLIKHEFVKRAHRRYQQEGLEIPFPIRTLYIKEPSQVTNGAGQPAQSKI